MEFLRNEDDSHFQIDEDYVKVRSWWLYRLDQCLNSNTQSPGRYPLLEGDYVPVARVCTSDSRGHGQS